MVRLVIWDAIVPIVASWIWRITGIHKELKWAKVNKNEYTIGATWYLHLLYHHNFMLDVR